MLKFILNCYRYLKARRDKIKEKNRKKISDKDEKFHELKGKKYHLLIDNNATKT